MTISVFFVGFGSFWLQELFFGLTSKKIAMQYLNILKFTKTFVANMCVLSWKKVKKWLHFSWVRQKIIKHFSKKKSFSVLKGAIFGPFEHTKTFFLAKCFIIFLSHSWKMFLFKSIFLNPCAVYSVQCVLWSVLVKKQVHLQCLV